jgi:hypothetical protein
MKRLVLLFLLLTNVFCAFAQDVRFTASAPNVVEVGETFRLVYSLDKKGEGIELGDLKNFQVLMGPSVSNSYSTRIINGRRSSRTSQSFSYVLSATKAGVYTIAPANIRVDGKALSSDIIKIEVVKARAQNQNTNRQRQSRDRVNTSNNIDNHNLFLKIEVDKRSIYMGEFVIASLKLYSRVELSNYGRFKLPSFQGFLSQDIKLSDKINLNKENVNGEIYNVGVLKKLVLFPQHSGKIKIDPFELDIYVRQNSAGSGSLLDNFFANHQEVKVPRKSKALTINVKSLPLKGKPSSFMGTVGSFKLKTSISRDTVMSNDAVSLKVKISGNGNLKLIEPLDMNFPADFEIYDPKISQNIKSTVKGTRGSVSFEYVFIPRSAGQYTIAPQDFTYFDTKTRRYKTLKTKQFSVYVKKGKQLANSGDVVASFSKEDVKFIGKDIRFIKTKNTSLYERGQYVYASVNYYLAYIISFLAFVFIILLNKRRIKNNSDMVRVKNKRASKLAKKRLRTAEAKMKVDDKDAFYDEILKAIWGFTSDKLNMPISALSKDNIADVLKDRKIDEVIISEYLSVVDTCEFARYSPSSSNTELNDLYERVSALLTKLS